MGNMAYQIRTVVLIWYQLALRECFKSSERPLERRGRSTGTAMYDLYMRIPSTARTAITGCVALLKYALKRNGKRSARFQSFQYQSLNCQVH